MKTLICMVLGLAALSSTIASASEWKRVELISRKGQVIQLNFQLRSEVYDGKAYTVARPLWINVTRRYDGLARVVLLNHHYSKNSRTQPVIVQDPMIQLDLVPQGRPPTARYSPFAGEVKGGLVVDSETDRYFQEIALVDETGEWQKDPISGLSNFSFSLYEAGLSGN